MIIWLYAHMIIRKDKQLHNISNLEISICFCINKTSFIWLTERNRIRKRKQLGRLTINLKISPVVNIENKWLDVSSHLSSFNQSECFISAQHSYVLINFNMTSGLRNGNKIKMFLHLQIFIFFISPMDEF